MKKRYPCVRVKQTSNSKELLLFSASAVDIDSWIGIPQRLSLGGAETAGFQRTVSNRREQALRKFFSEPKNIIQNPLLCAIRREPGVQVTFESSEVDPSIGHVVIEFEDYSKLSTPELLKAARICLEQRVPMLADRARPDDLVAVFQGAPALAQSDSFIDGDLLPEEGDPLTEDESLDNGEDEPAEEALFDESQITEFWDQLRAREVLSEKMPEMAFADEVFGFSRAMLESYLRPVILVDGQHRLTGALLAARDEVDNSKEASELVFNGVSAKDARHQLLVATAKHLPVSLLMNESPAEHVFQYVVVNQKATPVPKALLGTIISTSLAAGELESIAERLEEAKIPLEGSRIVSILSRAADSPFAGLVAKGMENEGAGKLPWSVLGSLADIFRYLENGRFYHEQSDHAKTWRNHQLAKSGIVSDWHTRGYESPYAYWQDLNGPWINVFKSFWTRTRDVLANNKDSAAKNCWGSPRDSNIFNKPSLHILTADFFCFLRETKATIDSIDDVRNLVDDWLEYASPQYFARDWKLGGVKKDSVGTRKQWSKLWATHRREGGKEPAPAAFSQLFKA
ncbi:ParB N-terminal domain-containing protein [Chromobacterium haemolyticum]|uniref:hypothetical protein n=1 Tax=Chromobacterium haemolyticum TaxID=394935 RepID=UPI0005B9E85D|nr:hypothetical protein [Chromobacterium haemolyticum]